VLVPATACAEKDAAPTTSQALVSARRDSEGPQRGIGRRRPAGATQAAADSARPGPATTSRGATASGTVSTAAAGPADARTAAGLPATTTTAIVTTTTEAPLTEPVRVRIPAIGVDAQLVPVGLKANGEMVVPATVAGWYDLGPKPGETGPAVIVAHRSWSGKPGVFHRLNELSGDDLVEVLYQSGRVERFGVEQSETHLKSQLPVKSIWNDAQEPVLRVITCGGTFNQRTRHYDSNIIVFASSLDG
jgi:hypothetical protein